MWITFNLFIGLLNGLFLTKFVARVDDKRPFAAALWVGAATATLEAGNQVWAMSNFSVWSLVTFIFGVMITTYFVVLHERRD